MENDLRMLEGVAIKATIERLGNKEYIRVVYFAVNMEDNDKIIALMKSAVKKVANDLRHTETLGH